MTAEGLWCWRLIIFWYDISWYQVKPILDENTTTHLSLQAWQAWLRAWGVSRPQFIAIWAIKKTMFSPPMKFVAKLESHWLWVMIVLNKAFSITPLTKKRMYHGMVKPRDPFGLFGDRDPSTTLIDIFSPQRGITMYSHVEPDHIKPMFLGYVQLGWKNPLEHWPLPW